MTTLNAHPHYFFMGGDIYEWNTGTLFGSLTEFAEMSKGKMWVAGACNKSWFKYRRIDGENQIVEIKIL